MKTLLLFGAAFALSAQVSVTTGQYDNSRDGANTQELVLTQAKVTAGKFGKLGSWTLDGYPYGQPLIVAGNPNILVVCTMNATCYAFNADTPGSAALWSNHVGTAVSGPNGLVVGGQIGCLATPVIDTTTSVVYATCVTVETAWRLYAWNLSDGSNYHTQVAIAGTYNGLTYGSGVSVTNQIQRTALLLSGSNIVFGMGSGGFDSGAYKGWIFAYDKTSLAQTGIWAAGTGTEAVWMAGGGIAADGDGNLYFSTGNGAWDGVTNFGESFVKLDSTLNVLSYGTPSDYVALNASDIDLGATRVMLTGGFLMGGGKSGKFWLMNQSDLGSLQGTNTGPVQAWTATTGGNQAGGIYGSGEAFANSTLYVTAIGDDIKRFVFNGSTFNTTPLHTSGSLFMSALTYSSNGSTVGTDILWNQSCTTNTFTSTTPGKLTAFNATTMGQIYSSLTNAADDLGNCARWVAPTVANGRVYVASFSSTVSVYGLLPSTQSRGGIRNRGASQVR